MTIVTAGDFWWVLFSAITVPILAADGFFKMAPWQKRVTVALTVLLLSVVAMLGIFILVGVLEPRPR